MRLQLAVRAGGGALLIALAIGSAHADQYRSEVRELEKPPPKAQPQDAKKLLETTTDPYARALLLRDLAGQAVAAKNYAQAAKYLEQALAQKSLSGIADEAMRRDLSQLYMASGRTDDVIKALEPLVRNNPKASPEQLAALGGAYLQQKRYKDAVPLLRRAVAGVPNPQESWQQALAAALVQTGQDAEAGALLEKLLRKNPANRDYWLQSVALQLKAGKTERAAALMELANRQGHLQNGEERLQLVGLVVQIGAPYEGAAAMQSWLESGQIPKTDRNWEMLAGAWLEARESALALAALRELQRRSPRAETQMQIGQLHLDRQEYAQAASALEGAMANTQRPGPTLLSLGLAHFHNADLERALEAFRGAERYPAQRAQAEQWIKFLESGAAKAPTAVASTRAEPQQLASRLLGATVSVQGAGDYAAGAATPAGRAAGAGGLTAIGAEQSGNADGTIPEWTGGLAQPPPGYKRGGRLVDPFAADAPRLTITGANAAQHAARLSDGHRQLLRRYRTYKLQVYPTRRSAAYPQAIYDASQANAGKAKLLGSDSLTGARLGFPFPKPQNGVEIMWNHRTRFRGNSVHAQSTQAVVGKAGISSRLKQVERVFYRYANLKDPIDLADQNILLYYLTYFSEAGGKSADFVAVVHETANSLKDRRAIWVLPPGIRKMFRIPPVGYDQPFPGSEGLAFIDMVDMYNGAFDRYVWKLTGKRELYLPYNGYRIGDGRYKYDQLLGWPHFNQDAARYELHRVWVIEATERGGARHSFGKRFFYVDEDSWNVVLVENYDRQGNLWRFQEGHLLPFYDSRSSNCMPVITYDFKEQRYFANRLTAEDPPPQYDVPGMTSQEFLPAAVKNRYSR